MKQAPILRIASAATVAFVLVTVFARHAERPPSSAAAAALNAASPWLALLLLVFLGFLPAIESVETREADDAVAVPWWTLGALVASVALFAVGVRLGVLGFANGVVTTAIGGAGLLGIFVSVAMLLRTRDRARALPVWFWIAALGFVVGFPMLGAYGLTDPWETHYAEVSREMLARDDAVSPWWANEGWFHSKPVLLFWLESTSMRLFGAGFRAGEVLTSAAAHPEWAVRMPNLFAAVAGAAVLSEGVARRFGRHAGLLGGAVLWMSPFYLLMARQAITDMPMVAGIEASAGFLLLRGSAGSNAEAQSFRLGRHRFTLRASWPLTLGASFLLVSQLLYITSRGGVPPFSIHRDFVRAGSFGTCGVLPDHPSCDAVMVHAPWLTPYVQGALFGVLAIVVIQEFASTTDHDTLALYGAYLAAAFAAMAKGPLGLVLPAAVFAADAISRRRYADLVPSKQAHIVGLLAAAIAILPWYIATYARHGRLFYDDLVLRHMFGRALEHLHDVNEQEDTGVRYYVAQLGYGALPLVALLPSAILGALRDRRRLSLLAWAAVCFALVTLMKTKFHHYVFPVVPPLAMLVGIEGTRSARRSWWPEVFGLGCALSVTADLVFPRGATEGPARFIALLCYRYDRAWPTEFPASRAYVLCLVLALLMVFAVRALRGNVMAGMLGMPLALFLALVYCPVASSHFGQRPGIEAFARESANGRASEPLIAYHLNWKGENYYSGNRVALFIRSGTPFTEYMSKRRALGVSQFHVATETASLGALRSEISGEATLQRLTTDQQGNRFTLVRVTFPTARR